MMSISNRSDGGVLRRKVEWRKAIGWRRSMASQPTDWRTIKSWIYWLVLPLRFSSHFHGQSFQPLYALFSNRLDWSMAHGQFAWSLWCYVTQSQHNCGRYLLGFKLFFSLELYSVPRLYLALPVLCAECTNLSNQETEHWPIQSLISAARRSDSL